MHIFGSIDIAMFDWPWSGMHAASGLLIGLSLGFARGWQSRKRFWVTGLMILLAWELVERTLRFLDMHAHTFMAPFKASVMSFAFGEETFINSFGDMVIGSAGLFLGRWLAMFRVTPKREKTIDQ